MFLREEVDICSDIERINRLKNALTKLGVEKGDRIGMLQVNCNQCGDLLRFAKWCYLRSIKF